MERQLSALVAAMPQNSSFLESEFFLFAADMPICVGSYTQRPGILRSCQILWLQCVAGDQESMSRSKFSVDLLPADG